LAIGPPRLAPNWFWLSSGLGWFWGAKWLRELSPSLRLNSQAAPRQTLLPDLVTTLTIEPALRPYSAP
jgi:hypothetical protein